MAREAGAGEPESLYGRTDYVVMTRFELERFFQMAQAAEREACAKLCETFYNHEAKDCAEAIRARSSK